MRVRKVLVVASLVMLGASPAPAFPAGRPHPAHLDGVVEAVDFGTGVVKLGVGGRTFAVTVPGTTPIKQGTETRSIVDFRKGITRIHVDGSAVGDRVTASSIDIKE